MTEMPPTPRRSDSHAPESKPARQDRISGSISGILNIRELPIIIEPLAADDYYNQTRQPVEAVYAQIESDLLAAMQVLPQKSNYPAADLGRATKGAATGILAKLYMVKKDYPKAIEACRLSR